MNTEEDMYDRFALHCVLANLKPMTSYPTLMKSYVKYTQNIDLSSIIAMDQLKPFQCLYIEESEEEQEEEMENEKSEIIDIDDEEDLNWKYNKRKKSSSTKTSKKAKKPETNVTTKAENKTRSPMISWDNVKDQPHFVKGFELEITNPIKGTSRIIYEFKLL